MDRPKHRVVPRSGIAQEQCVLDSPPRQTIIADRVGDEVVIGKHEVKEVVDAVVVEDIDITQRFSAAGGF